MPKNILVNVTVSTVPKALTTNDVDKTGAETVNLCVIFYRQDDNYNCKNGKHAHFDNKYINKGTLGPWIAHLNPGSLGDDV